MPGQTLTQKQLLILAGALPALLIIQVVWQHAGALFARLALPGDDPASRLAYVARWLLLPGLTLLAGILATGLARAALAGAIDGTPAPTSRPLAITLRYNQNTLEQLLLAAIAWAGVALAVTRAHLVVIPAMACLFAFGRIVFWIGYLLHPQARAFGLILTLLPTVLAYGWLVLQLRGAPGP